MDNRYLYYSPAELAFRRQRARKALRRRESRSRWLRRRSDESTT